MREYVQSIFLKKPEDVCAHVHAGFGARQAHGFDGSAMFSIAMHKGIKQLQAGLVKKKFARQHQRRKPARGEKAMLMRTPFMNRQ
jgi:hypothetical protein